MRYLYIPFLTLLTFSLPHALESQSLFKDSKALSSMLKELDGAVHQREINRITLQQTRTGAIPLDSSQAVPQLTTLQTDSALVNLKVVGLSGKILAILDHYLQGDKEESARFASNMDKIRKVYSENKTLAPFLSSIDFELVLDTFPQVFQHSFNAYRDTLRSSAKREKILSIMNSQDAQSPLEYLSVSRTLEDYQQPPLSAIKFAEASAQASNKNINKGIVNQQALIIGLFSFLVDRAQEEVVITFLERLLGKNGIQQFREIFPNTSTSFQDLDFTYSESFLERLRQAFYEDIQLLSVSLPSLLTNPDYFQLLENDPIAYNFLQLYSMVAMGQQGAPIAEIVPLTFRNLFDRYQDEKKAINLQIAKNYHTYSEYQVLSGTTQEILRDILSITGILDSFQQETMQQFTKLLMDPFTITIDSTIKDSTLVIDKINITGKLNTLAQEGEEAFFNLFNPKKTSTATTLVKAPVDVYVNLGEFPEEDLTGLNGFLLDKITVSTLESVKYINGGLDLDKSSKEHKNAFFQLMKQKPSNAAADKVEKPLNILVTLGKFDQDTLDYYTTWLATMKQPKLSLVKFEFEFKEYLLLTGRLEKIPKKSVDSLLNIIAPGQSNIQISNKLKPILNAINNTNKLISKKQSTLSLIINPTGILYLSGQPDSIQQTALEKLQAQTKTNLPADTIPLVDRAYQGLLPILNGEADYSLKMLPSLLNAKFDANIVKSWSTLGSYDKFLRNPLSDQQLRAAGLALTRQLNNAWYEDMTIVQMLSQWQNDVVAYGMELKRWNEILFPEAKLAADKAAYEKARRDLSSLIDAMHSHYGPEVNSNEAYAFEVLKEILQDSIFNGELAEGLRDKITKGEAEIYGVQERLLELDRKLARASSAKGKTSPIIKYFDDKKEVDLLQQALYKIDDLDQSLSLLQAQLNTLDERTASLETKALSSISPIVQITETLSHLMYCLQDDESPSGWIQKEALNEVLLNAKIFPAFLGLLTQQLGQVSIKGNFSIPALTNFVKLTVQDLDLLTAKRFTADSIDLDFYRKAAFVNFTLNRMLTLPLFIDQNQPDKTQSLVDKYPELEPIPDLSDQALDFIFYTNIKDHRHALSSLIRLFSQIIEVVEDRKGAAALKPKPLKVKGSTVQANKIKKNIVSTKAKKIKSEDALAFIKKYGDFMADLIDADTSTQVQDLLKKFADPPGSSRDKRRYPFTANINGYVGGSIGQETLTGEALTGKKKFTSFAPTLPVGLSFSKIIGKGEKPQSFSLFLSILDLGSLTTFSFDSKIEGDNLFSIKNVLKPGLQLHWNIKNSPFFLGAGSQFGPQYREFNGEQKQLNSVRVFFNFGVDVVIKRLH